MRSRASTARVPSLLEAMDKSRLIKYALVAAAVIIAAASLIVSQSLINDLKREEQNKVETWAEAMRSLIKADENADLNLVLRVINSNHTIPVIVLDEAGEVLDHRNVTLDADEPDSLATLKAEATAMRQAGREMRIQWNADTPAEGYFSICYGESVMLRRLTIYPYVQLGVVSLFIAIAFFALLSSKRAEQNKVWVGLSRETAHQLGTPISSLMAWTEILKELHPDEPVIDDLGLDVRRLQLIAERFSKIGSAPLLTDEELSEVISRALTYMSRRSSGRVHISLEPVENPITVCINPPLFEWVIENLCKNAIDAMSGIGSITVSIHTATHTRLFRRPRTWAVVEVTDTGKGIAKSHFKTVFRPGFTTKKRGWGLGLSLAKRIVEQYHRGEIFVKSSELGVGTTFCIRLPQT